MKKYTTHYLSHELLIIENDRILSIPYTEIKAISCDKPYILIETTSKKYQVTQNLTGFCKELPPYIIQCNKSTYISLLQVNSIQKNHLGYEAHIQGTTFPIARRRIAEIKIKFIQIRNDITEFGTCFNCKICKMTV